MKYRHYAPGAKVTVVLPGQNQSIEDAFLAKLEKSLQPAGLFLSEAAWELVRGKLPGMKVYTYGGGRDLTNAMYSLFDALRTLDEMGVKEILAEGFPGEEAAAYMDRLAKASLKEREGLHILFVCEGNTCRSPMAEAIFNDRFAEHGVSASSAGLSAIRGQEMAELAIEALEEWGIGAGHRPSRQIRAKSVRDADLIVAMTENQGARLRLYYPHAAGRIVSMADFLDGRDISDPFGQALHAYRRVRDQLASVMQRLFDQLILM